jgi:hypothetical protein
MHDEESDGGYQRREDENKIMVLVGKRDPTLQNQVLFQAKNSSTSATM